MEVKINLAQELAPSEHPEFFAYLEGLRFDRKKAVRELMNTMKILKSPFGDYRTRDHDHAIARACSRAIQRILS